MHSVVVLTPKCKCAKFINGSVFDGLYGLSTEKEFTDEYNLNVSYTSPGFHEVDCKTWSKIQETKHE